MTANPEEVLPMQGQSETERQLAIRVEELLDRMAQFKRPCKKCGVALWFIRHQNGALAPYTHDATNHFANCPNSKEFKKAKVAGAGV